MATDVGQFWGLILPLYGALRLLRRKTMRVWWCLAQLHMGKSVSNTSIWDCWHPADPVWKTQAISGSVFVSQRFLNGLMVWTHTHLPLIVPFSLPEWFSCGSLCWHDIYLSQMNADITNRIVLLLMNWRRQSGAVVESFCLAGYPVQASSVMHSSSVVLMLECTAVY